MILTVCPDDQLGDYLVGALQNEWPQSKRVCYLEEALKELETNTVKVLILDSLIETSLERFVSRISRDYPHIPIILLASHDKFNEAVRLLRWGVSDVVQRKPFESELVFVVDQVLSSVSHELPVHDVSFYLFFRAVLGQIDFDKRMVGPMDMVTQVMGLSSVIEHESFDRMKSLSGLLEEGLQSFHVGIVEDEPELASVLRRLMERQGWGVTVSGSVQEAKLMLNTGKAFDLIVLDLGLPDGTGDELMEHVPEDTAIMVLTAYQDFELAVSTIKNGALGYITKPFDNKDLIYRMKKALVERLLKYLIN